ncbi:hypothetical protein GCM10010399_24790 [Dactylosporangium fulvum]
MFESAVTSLDRIVGLLLGVVPRGRDHSSRTSGVDRGGGDDLAECHFNVDSAHRKNRRAAAVSRRVETSTSMTWPCWSTARHTYRQIPYEEGVSHHNESCNRNVPGIGAGFRPVSLR